MAEQSLYERLGGVFAIAAVVDHFSDAVVKNPIVGQGSDNPALREWHTQQLGPAAGPEVHADAVGLQRGGRSVQYVGTKPGPRSGEPGGGPPALGIAPDEFDAVAGELGRTLDQFKVPQHEKDEVLAAFAAHKGEVTEGSLTAGAR